MAVFRNRCDDELLVPVGLRTFRVEPDDTFEVPDQPCACNWTAEDGTPRVHEWADHYDLNDRLVRVASPTPAPPSVDAPE